MKNTLTLPRRASVVGFTDALSGGLSNTRRWWYSIKDHDAITKAGFLMYAILLCVLGVLTQVIVDMSFIFCVGFFALAGSCVVLAWRSKSISQASAVGRR